MTKAYTQTSSSVQGNKQQRLSKKLQFILRLEDFTVTKSDGFSGDQLHQFSVL